MRRIILIATAAIATLGALPAAADTARTIPARAALAAATRTAMDGSTVCVRRAGAKGCADYQAQLLRTVGVKAAASNTNISVNDLGRRQLDALIASIN